MKKIVFTVIAILYSVSAFCQATQEGVGSVDFPEAASKITKEQAMEHIRNKFDNDPVLVKTHPFEKQDHQYIIKDVLVNVVFTRISNGKKVDLDQKKKDDDSLFGREKTYHSEIRTVNNNSIYIKNRMVSASIEIYSFFIFKADGTKVITGSLEFQHNNKEAAKAILDHILTHARFKE